MEPERWEIDSGHSGIYFAVRHMMLSRVRGQFTRWSGSLEAPKGAWQGTSIGILIDATSLFTGNEERDAHLKSADFLQTATFPALTFHGVVSDKSRDRGLRIQGELGALGRVHPIAFEVKSAGRTTDFWGHERAGFSARGSLDLKGLGLTWNKPLEDGGYLVGSEVDFEIEVEAVFQDPAQNGFPSAESEE